MIKTETTLRVRYGETDQMGFVYYGVYAQYYEVGRVEAMRSLGFSYREMEESGVLMPVINFTVDGDNQGPMLIDFDFENGYLVE